MKRTLDKAASMIKDTEAGLEEGVADLVRLLRTFADSTQVPVDETPTLQRAVYVRKFFFDFLSEEPQWYMMRLANGRTQISHPNERTQVRWISHSLQAMDSVPKYRVLAGGVPEPFSDETYFASIRRSLEKFEEAE